VSFTAVTFTFETAFISSNELGIGKINDKIKKRLLMWT